MSIKQAILRTVETVGLNRWSRFRTRRQLLGLCYHTIVSDESPADDARTQIAVTVSEFERQMRELHRHWTPVSTAQIRAAVFEGVPLPDRAVHVSFDDGYRNNLVQAAPILAKYEIPATVFITTELIGTRELIWPLELHERLVVWPNLRLRYSETAPPLPIMASETTLPDTVERSQFALEIVQAAKRLTATERSELMTVLRNETEIDLTTPWKKELYELLDWDEVRKLRDLGIDIGAHTQTHPNLALLDAGELDRELRGCKEQIDRELADPCDTLAYPFGSGYDYSDRVVAAAQAVGFRLAFTLQERRNGVVLDPMRVHRICIHREHSLDSFRCLISGLRNC